MNLTTSEKIEKVFNQNILIKSSESFFNEINFDLNKQGFPNLGNTCYM